jgi:DNA-binding LacI/PurR family transcriptional regulator
MFLENYILSEYEKAEIKNSILALADRVDGFILDERVPDSIIKECMEKISKPMVIVNRVSSLDIPTVTCDNRLGSEKAAETALKMGYDHFIICELDSEEKNINILSRLKYFREYLEKNKITEIETVKDCNFNPYTETLDKLLRTYERTSRKNIKSLIFTPVATLARDLGDSFTEKGISFGKGLGLICFEATGYARLRKPYISAININCYDIGTKAVEIISSSMLSNYFEHKKGYIIPITFQIGDTL